MKKFSVMVMSVNTEVTADKKTSNNIMNVKGVKIKFNSTFKVETFEVLNKLLKMKKGHVLIFKKEEAKILNNALLKIEREQCYNRLTEYTFLVYSKGMKKGKVLVVRERD